jgi:putative FmdB family regulatory protein
VGRRLFKGSNLDSKSKEKITMALYEYDCMPCAQRYVKERSIKDDDPGYHCATCNSPLVRVYSNVGAVFNGSGFYSTDNRKR